jgi:serine protease Do
VIFRKESEKKRFEKKHYPVNKKEEGNMKKILQGGILPLLFLTFLSTTVAQSEEIQLDKYQKMAYRVKPAVVQIAVAVAAKIIYQSENSQIQDQTFEGSGGSGFIVNPDGYIVTNGHVVQLAYEYDKDKEKILNGLLISFVVRKLQQEKLPVTPQNAKKWIQAHQPRIAQEQSFRKVLISNGDVYDFEIKKYSPFVMQGGKDVSVIKIEAKDLPIVSLGNSSELKLQQLVFPFGYPGVASPGPLGEGHPALGGKTALEVSITRGTVSALKVDYKGVPVIQTDAAITHGNSGGPACNENGEVIGISTLGSMGKDPYTGQPIEVAGFNFLVPIDTAKEFINEAGVKFNVPSKFNEKYNAALDATWNKEWFTARDLINSGLVFLPNQPDLVKLRQYVEGRISEMGWFTRNWQRNKIAMVSLGVIILLIAIVGVTFLAKKAPQKGAQPTPQPVRQPRPTEVASEGETRVEGKFFGSLTLSTAGQMGKSYPIGEKGVVIGREPSQCEIVIPDANVSRVHAWVTIEKNEAVVIDRGSTNGTFVNNNKVEKTKLKSGDVIQLGQKCPTTLIFKA